MKAVVRGTRSLMVACCLAASLNVQAGVAQTTTASERRLPTPVHWSAEPLPKPVRPGRRFIVLLHAAVDSGWHLYALQEPDGGPIPTEIALAQSDPADLRRVDQESPRQAIDPQFHLRTASFDGSTTFTLRLQAARAPAAAARVLHILIRYQACNDRVCLPLQRESVEVSLQAGTR